MKRFTQTEKWDDPWFRSLPAGMKCFWLYLCDRCDPAGVWEVDMQAAAWHIGEVLPLDKVWATFGERIEKVQQVGNGTHAEKWRVVKFVQFQYPNLSRTCKPHAGVFASMEKYGLQEKALKEGKVSQRLAKRKGNLTDTTKRKETDTEKETEQDKEAAPDQAEAIYQLYPRKIAKGDAITAIKNVLKAKTPEFLVEAVTAYAAAVAQWPDAEQAQFVPHPATWFNRGSYDDDRSTWSRGGKNSEPNEADAFRRR